MVAGYLGPLGRMNMVKPQILSREVVCETIGAWGKGAISDEEMHLWATNNYFPLHQQVAPGHPEHVALAIGIALTEFECTTPPYQFGRDVALRAIALIDASASEFASKKAAFVEAVQGAKHAP